MIERQHLQYRIINNHFINILLFNEHPSFTLFYGINVLRTELQVKLGLLSKPQNISDTEKSFPETNSEQLAT